MRHSSVDSVTVDDHHAEPRLSNYSIDKGIPLFVYCSILILPISWDSCHSVVLWFIIPVERLIDHVIDVRMQHVTSLVTGLFESITIAEGSILNPQSEYDRLMVL